MLTKKVLKILSQKSNNYTTVTKISHNFTVATMDICYRIEIRAGMYCMESK